MKDMSTFKTTNIFLKHDEGYVNVQDYQHLLDLTKALYFEVYHHDPNEKYRIKYIMVDVDLD